MADAGCNSPFLYDEEAELCDYEPHLRFLPKYTDSRIKTYKRSGPISRPTTASEKGKKPWHESWKII